MRFPGTFRSKNASRSDKQVSIYSAKRLLEENGFVVHSETVKDQTSNVLVAKAEKKDIPYWRKEALKKASYLITWLWILLSTSITFFDYPGSLQDLFQLTLTPLSKLVMYVITLLCSIVFWHFFYPGGKLAPKIMGFLWFPIAFSFGMIPSFTYELSSKFKSTLERFPTGWSFALAYLTSIFTAFNAQNQVLLNISKYCLVICICFSIYMVVAWVSSPYGWLEKFSSHIDKLPNHLLADLIKNAPQLKGDKEGKDKVENAIRGMKLFNYGTNAANFLANEKFLLWIFILVTCGALSADLIAMTAIAKINIHLYQLHMIDQSFLNIFYNVGFHFFGQDNQLHTLGFNHMPMFLLSVSGLGLVYLVMIMTAFGVVTTEAASKSRDKLLCSINEGRKQYIQKWTESTKQISDSVFKEFLTDPKISKALKEHSLMH